MEVLVAVVEAGNFTLAADQLEITSVMVGKHIRQLEEFLDIRLLNRSTRQQSLTDAGVVFYRRAKSILSEIGEAQDAVHDLKTELAGKLRISAPVSMGGCIVAPLLARYMERFPGVEIELVLGNKLVDLIEEDFDLAIRVGTPADSSLVARPLRPYRNLICGSPAYLSHAGVPQQWSDLDHHRCLAHQSWQAQWRLDDGTELAWPAKHVFSSNDGYALRAAAIAGAGLIIQPEALLEEAIRAGQLLPVLDAFLPSPLPVHLIYLQDPFPRRRLASLVDFLVAELR